MKLIASLLIFWVVQPAFSQESQRPKKAAHNFGELICEGMRERGHASLRDWGIKPGDVVSVSKLEYIIEYARKCGVQAIQISPGNVSATATGNGSAAVTGSGNTITVDGVRQ